MKTRVTGWISQGPNVAYKVDLTFETDDTQEYHDRRYYENKPEISDSEYRRRFEEISDEEIERRYRERRRRARVARLTDYDEILAALRDAANGEKFSIEYTDMEYHRSWRTARFSRFLPDVPRHYASKAQYGPRVLMVTDDGPRMFLVRRIDALTPMIVEEETD